MVQIGVIGCSLCQLANAVSHKNQQIFQALPCDGPFDIISIDVWTPGDIPGKYKNQKVITCLCMTTGFASLAFAHDLKSETMAQKCFNNFFVPNGLLRLVLIDPASENKGDVICMCENIGIVHCVVAPKDHDVILNE